MRLTQRVSVLTAAMLLAGCSSYSTKPVTTVLPSSNRSIDIVLHRGDVRVMDCATLAVLQTYNSEGGLIDSKEARGTALHCTVLPALIDAGGRVGAAAMVRPAITTIRNAVSATAGANAGASATGGNATGGAGGNAIATGGNGGEGGAGGTGGNGGTGGQGGNGGENTGGGNNGGGNGDNDGTNNGSDNHHDNGDNS